MIVDSEICQILRDDRLDNEVPGPSRVDLIDAVIDCYGWRAVHDYLIEILRDDNAAYRDWQTAADVFLGAAFDKRQMNENLVIGLIYRRLIPDEGSTVNNQAWSIACELKRLNYTLSDYDPRTDPEVIEAMKPGH